MQITRCAIFLVLILLATACSTVPSSIQVEDFDRADIRSLAIIYKQYMVTEDKALGFPQENVNAEFGLYTDFNSTLTQCLHKYGFSIITVPDSLKTNKERILLREDVIQLIALMTPSNRRKMGYLQAGFESSLWKYQEYSGTQYLVFIVVNGMYSKPGKVALDVMSGIYSHPFYLNLRFGIVNAQTNRVLWYSEKLTSMDPTVTENVEALVKSLLFDLLYDIELPPASFIFNPARDNPVHVYTIDGRKITGRIAKVDVFDLIVEDNEGNSEILSLLDVSSIQHQTMGTEYFRRGTRR